jgi:vancomycin resistance protein YoaR
MSKSRRTLIVAALVAAGLLLLAAAAFGLDRFVHSGEVLRNVEVAGVDLSGLNEEAAIAALLTFEDSLAETPAPFTVAGVAIDLHPVSVGFNLDEASALDGAFQTGRQGSIVGQFGWWIRHLLSTEVLPIDATLDADALDQVLAEWDSDLITDHPSPGDVILVDGTPVATYPTPGTEIDREGSAGVMLDSLLSTTRIPQALPTRPVAPPLTDTHIDAAVASATRMLAAPVTLSRDDPVAQVVFTTADLVEAFETELVLEPQPVLLLGFSSEVVSSVLEPLRAELEVPPVDARFEFGDDDRVSIVPGRPGTIIDPELAAAALETAALTVSRAGELPFEVGADPEVTTEELEAMGVKGLVSEATTNHPCCQPRVANIHLFADIVNGTLVRPGESLSLNELVGERTSELGFEPAPTIIRGKIVDTVGGGVSQFATTFYNAVFWGGYEDVTHTPHSYYFSRYPEGIEATISWPLPNLDFRNDTDAAVLIKTEYDDTSITVKFFGDNGGRTVEGEVSDRYNFTEPTTDYIANDALEPGQQKVNVEGRSGWSVTVTRTITERDGTVREQTWVVRYKAQPWEIQVHSCTIPAGAAGYTGEDCPVPETTTTLAPPTTTTPPATGTTVGG